MRARLGSRAHNRHRPGGRAEPSARLGPRPDRRSRGEHAEARPSGYPTNARAARCGSCRSEEDEVKRPAPSEAPAVGLQGRSGAGASRSVLDEGPEAPPAKRRTELAKGLRFDLPDALARHVETLTDLLEH